VTPAPVPLQPGVASVDAARERWLALIALVAVMVVGLILRVALWPSQGLVGDLDQFVVWAHGVAVGPIGHAYDQDISFPPVMVYLWAVLGAIEPALRTATTSADPAIRAVMKAPASLADLGIAALIAWHLRATPRWAVLGALMIVFHPAVIDTSAWWGQYESLFVAPAVAAFVLAVRGHSLAAAALLAISLMTKPQAFPLAVPFAAWFLARDGLRGALRAAAVGAFVIVVVWLPFIPAGGIQHYSANVAAYQSDVYAILSLRAWNLWWLVQGVFAGDAFVSDKAAVLGPVTLRHVGYGLALLGEVAVFAMVFRSRSPRGLAYGLTASALVAFALLTSMHERYAYAALAFLPLAFPDARALVASIAFGAIFTLNLLAAAPPTDVIAALPFGGLVGILGSLAMLAILGVTMSLLRTESLDDRPGANSRAELVAT
jgi:dolichyl-phosphate-mannose-protein mannosyltransferase